MKFVIKKNPAAAQPFYFLIVAANGQTIAVSEMYSRKQSAIDTINSFTGELARLATAGQAPEIEDETGVDLSAT